jgi:hypothetical protein
MMTSQIPDRRIHKQWLGRSESYVVLLEKRRSLFPLNRESIARVAIFSSAGSFLNPSPPARKGASISVAGMIGFQIVENSASAGKTMRHQCRNRCVTNVTLSFVLRNSLFSSNHAFAAGAANSDAACRIFLLLVIRCRNILPTAEEGKRVRIEGLPSLLLY